MGSDGGPDIEAHPGRGLGSNKEEPDGLAERVVPMGSDDEVENDVPQKGVRFLFNKFIWHGGSVYDAWLTASSAQVILSMPTSYAQMGFKWGVALQLFYTILGVWTCYLLARLYVEYRHRKETEGHDFKKHVIQDYEVIASLVAPWARNIVLFFNIMTIGSVATVQIIACASNAYYLSDHLDKQQWALVFGTISMFMVLVPSLHNFRIFSLAGILTTTYTAWYIFIASLKHGQVEVVRHSGPRNLPEFFTGTTNILFSTGGHAVTVEIMHAMRNPKRYKYVYVVTCLYILTITMPHCIATYWAFGDVLLTHGNAFSVFPVSAARTTGLIFMIAHQAVAFGLYVMPLFFMWEKLWGIHEAWFPLRVVMRLPVAALLWFLALAFPFFGPINSFVGAMFMSFSTFMIPCLAFLYAFGTPQALQNAAEKTSKFLPRGKALVLTNVVVVAIIAVLGTGLGGYCSIYDIAKQINTFGLFESMPVHAQGPPIVPPSPQVVATEPTSVPEMVTHHHNRALPVTSTSIPPPAPIASQAVRRTTGGMSEASVDKSDFSETTCYATSSPDTAPRIRHPSSVAQRWSEYSSDSEATLSSKAAARRQHHQDTEMAQRVNIQDPLHPNTTSTGQEVSQVQPTRSSRSFRPRHKARLAAAFRTTSAGFTKFKGTSSAALSTFNDTP